jgi:hypothetical protein
MGRWWVGIMVIQLLLTAVPATAQEYPEIRLSGSVRLRGEWDGRAVGAGDDAATLSRIRVGVRARLTDWARAFLQLQDARAWGTSGNTLTDASADQLDLHQGYAELGHTDGLRGRLGRQEIALADERLVGAVGWSNTGRSFDGVRALGDVGGVTWSAFWMNVAERDSLLAIGPNPQLNQGMHDDGWLIGGFASHTVGGATVELTALYDRQAITTKSYTVNLRVHGAAGVGRYEAAGAYQFGPDREAFFASGRAGVAVGRASAAAQLDYVSGDADPTDGEIRAFNTLYATNHKFYGYMDYFLALPAQLDQAGLMDAMLRGSLGFPHQVRVRIDLHHFRTAQERSGVSTLGTEVDLVGSWDPVQYVGLEAGGGMFFPEDLLPDLLPAFAAGTSTTYWGYAQLTLRWP